MNNLNDLNSREIARLLIPIPKVGMTFILGAVYIAHEGSIHYD